MLCEALELAALRLHVLLTASDASNKVALRFVRTRSLANREQYTLGVWQPARFEKMAAGFLG